MDVPKLDWGFLEEQPAPIAENETRYEPLELVDFGIIDKQGRRIGVLVRMASAKHNGKMHFMSCTQTARDGQPFGGVIWRYYGSQEDADEAVLKSLRRSLARFAKLYGDVGMNFLTLQDFKKKAPRSSSSES